MTPGDAAIQGNRRIPSPMDRFACDDGHVAEVSLVLPDPKSLAELGTGRMSRPLGRRDYCSPCKAKTGPIFMNYRAMFGGEEYFLPKLGG